MNPSSRLSNLSLKMKTIIAALVATVVMPGAWAQITNVVDGNASVTVDFGSQAGMSQWTINGQNQLHQQWFWYGIGSGALASIDTLGTPNVVVSGSTITAQYTGPTFGINLTYTLSGSSPGQWTSDVTENISIYNLSGTAISDFHFYQYSDFQLAGSAGGEQSTIFLNNDGFFTKANVTKATNQLSETIDQPLANEGEAGIGSDTLNNLNGGGPYTLNGHTTAGPDPDLDATWALEWDFGLDAMGGDNDTMNVIKDKKLSVEPIPEPGFCSFGIAALAVFILRRRK